MSIAERLAHLENELEWLKATLDGSEEQTREAVATVTGLLMAFMAKKNVLDLGELAAFFAEAADPDRGAEDHNGQLVHDVRETVEFHRNLAAGTLKPYVPLKERMTADEIAGIRARAKARATFEREAEADATDRKGKRRRTTLVAKRH